jgi:alkaline phosphatase
MQKRPTTLAKRAFLIGLTMAAFAAIPARQASAAKNIIILIADGAGFNTWRATAMYEGKLGNQVYDGPGWVQSAASTYPLSQSSKPKNKGVQEPDLVYDPAKAWSVAPATETVTAEAAADPTKKRPLTPSEKIQDEEEKDKAGSNGKKKVVAAPKAPATRQAATFAGYVWLKKTYTDSAASATAMATGMKTYNNAINWTDRNQPMTGRTLAEIAKRSGKSVGVITSVPWSHATPAGFGGAHNVTRNDYKGIANEMLAAPYLDVIMGAGNPEFTDDGLPLKKDAKPDYNYVGGKTTWNQLKAGTHPGGWKLVETKADFLALTRGPTPEKVLGVAQVATTLQQKRGKGNEKKPLDCPFNRNVPALATMTKAAINCLDDNPKGFYLMIEGGAVDWANHSRHAPRMIEEQAFYLRAVKAVVDWVETCSSWDETLVILSADHETGLIWGPNSDVNAFQSIVDCGPGTVPGLRYNHASHSNSLVPLYARGPGAERFAKLVVGTDKTAAAKYGISGRYVDDTSIFTVANAECLESPPARPAPTVPAEPAASAR